MAAPTLLTRLRRMRFATVFLGVLGILVALYAFHVERTKELDPDYVAFCDLHEKVSCTKVLGSRYGKGFGVLGLIFGETSLLNQPNSIYGIVFYVLHICLDVRLSMQLAKVQVAASVAANLMSVYLAYLLAFVLHDLCVVCVATYLLNALLLVYNVKKLKLTQKLNASRPKRDIGKKAK